VECGVRVSGWDESGSGVGVRVRVMGERGESGSGVRVGGSESESGVVGSESETGFIRITGQWVRSLAKGFAFKPVFFLHVRLRREVHFFNELKSLSFIATSDMSKLFMFLQ
jgi:hypothetical protein